MNLEQRLTRPKLVVSKTPSSEVVDQINNGKAFIVVEDDFDKRNTPAGYSLVSMRYDDNILKTLVPKRAFVFMANPGNIDGDGPLDELAAFYNGAKDFEAGVIETGNTSVQVSQWATLARSSYRTYLINELVGMGQGYDADGEPNADFKAEVLDRLDLKDDYVADRVRILAALALGKNPGDIEELAASDVLKHYSKKGEVEKISQQELRKIAKHNNSLLGGNSATQICNAASHFELKEEYRNDAEFEYHLGRMEKVRKIGDFNDQARMIEEDIAGYRQEKGSKIGNHDRALIRMYANVAYIIREDSKAQLDVTPPRIDTEK